MVAIGLPDAAFLAAYYGYMEAMTRMAINKAPWSPLYDPWHMTVGVVLGIIAALYVASIVKRWIGPIVGNKPASATTPERERIRSRPEPERVATGG